MQINRIIAGLGGGNSSRALTGSSRLRWTVARMITTNSLAAFTQEVTRNRPALSPQGAPPGGAPPTERAARPEQVAERRLEAVPPQPSKPTPRGSLLDLKV
jgi:hypothetical protein